MINDFYSDNVHVTKETTHLLMQKLEREKKNWAQFLPYKSR